MKRTCFSWGFISHFLTFSSGAEDFRGDRREMRDSHDLTLARAEGALGPLESDRVRAMVNRP